MPSSGIQRDERIDIRISTDLKHLLSRAASYSGMSLSSFLVSVVADRAKEVVSENETFILTARDWDAFLNGLDEPDRPRPKLKAAARRYRARRKA